MRFIYEIAEESDVFDTSEYYLIGVKGISFSAARDFELEDAINLITKYNIVINAERLFSDDELKNAVNVIAKLNIKKNDLIFYSDFGFYNALLKTGYKDNLVFRAPTYLTSVSDANYYLELNHNVVAASEINYRELKHIVDNAKKPIIIDVFGKNVIFNSRRRLISTYADFRGVDIDPTLDYEIIEEKRNDVLEIRQDETGTHIYESSYQFLLDELDELNNVEFGIIHTVLLNKDQRSAVINAYREFLLNKDKKTFYNLINKNEIKIYKGALKIESVLLKNGGGCSE